MSASSSEITHVSDTALMVAACRAHESALEDAFLHDPFAARLAGERGVAILNAMPYANVARMGLAVRARFVDELLLEALAAYPIATVLNVGCGLDTRPWRLALPASLRWIEVDLPAILDYKETIMAGEKPRCRRERLTVDVTDPTQRHAMYEAAGRERALMITEGLLMYLPAATVDAIAAESWNQSGIVHWISDLTTSAFTKALSGTADAMKSVDHVRAPDARKGEGVIDALSRNGWSSATRRSYIADVGFVQERIRRSIGGKAPPPPPFPPNDPTGVHRFARG